MIVPHSPPRLRIDGEALVSNWRWPARVDAAPELQEGDWVELDYNLPAASAQSGLSQYELLTVLGDRYQRLWS